MSSYLALRSHVQQQHDNGGNGSVSAIVEVSELALAHEAAENAAATKIQSMARMRSQRIRFLIIRAKIVNIQRCYRGYLGRKRFLRHRISKLQSFNRAVFDHFASRIQACFRGFVLRKYTCDFYARKRYIRSVMEKSEQVRQDVAAQAELTRSQHEAAQRSEQLAEFRKATASLHHLLSTSAVSGIYRGPLSVDGCKTVFGTHMEDELRSVPIPHRRKHFKKDLLPTSTTATNAAAAGGGSAVPAATATATASIGSSCPPYHVPRAPSLQNSVPFEKSKEYTALERDVDRKLESAIHGPSGRFAVRRTDAPKFEKTIAVESEFVERSTIRVGNKKAI